MANNENGKIGKRKVTVALVYIIGVIGVASFLVVLRKITGTEFIGALDTAKYVALGYLGINAVNAAVHKFSNGGKK